MPLSEDGLRDVQGRVYAMLRETLGTIEFIEKNADVLFGENASEVKLAIDEYMKDFINNPNNSGEKDPKASIYETPKEKFQTAGLYGAQLNIKERQFYEANAQVRKSLSQGTRSFFRNPFKKWIERVNKFLASLVAATGFGEALKELKDCLRDELPDDD